MQIEEFSLRQTVAKIFSPLVKHPIRMISISTVIAIAIYFLVNVALAELVRQNVHDIKLLNLEQLHEVGPYYILAREDHIKFITKCENKIKQRNFATILRVLYPEYSAEKALAKVRDDLKVVVNSKSEEEAAGGIFQAGEATNQLYKIGEKFPRSPIAWFKPKDSLDSTSKTLDKNLDKFHKSVNVFVKTQTLETAKDWCRTVCVDSRRIFVPLYLDRFSYNNEEKTRLFQSDLERASAFAQRCAQNEKYKSKLDWFSGRARNIGHRAIIVDLMLDNNTDEICKVLDKAIKEALAKKTEKSNAPDAL